MAHVTLKIRPLLSFLHCFTLKQGTVLIAVVHLFAAGIAVIFCVLALTHAVDICEMVARDAEDAMDRGYFEDDNSVRTNIKRMKIAGDNAKDKVDEMWFHLIFWLSHLSCTILLLYGVLTFHRRFILPWMYLMAFEILVVTTVLVSKCHPFTVAACAFFMLQMFGVVAHFHCLYVVWSAYISVHWEKGLIVHEVHDSKKKFPLQFERESSSEYATTSSASADSLATKPYEV